MSESPEFIEHSLEFENCNIYVSNEYSENLDLDYLNIINKVVTELLKTIKCPKAKEFEFAMKLADNDTVHELNKQYRGKDYPTNVLSFEHDLEDDFVSIAIAGVGTGPVRITSKPFAVKPATRALSIE